MQVLVLHGGLFSQSGVLIEEIMEANRKEYNLADETRKARATGQGAGGDDLVSHPPPSARSGRSTRD